MQAFHFIDAADTGSAVVFASPHSGRHYPADLVAETRLDMAALRSSEDAYVDQFLRAAHGMAPVILGAVPRAYVDFNRAASELDPALIAGVSARGLNPRISSGLGVIPRVVAGGRAIYSGKLSRAQADARLHDFWHPYHAKLTEVIATQRRRFGRAILFDMHSMPRDAVNMSDQHTRLRPDIVLGDRFGATADARLTEAVAQVFTRAGFRVARNSPFAGAYITQRYGLPSMGQHAIQIEIDRSLYMDEKRIELRADVAAFMAVMDQAVRELIEIGLPSIERDIAAE